MPLCSDDKGDRMLIRSHLLHAVRHAQREILLASAYFLPDRGLLQALRAAARRGVEVRILLPGQSDLQSVQIASEHIYDRLLSAGIHIHSWPDTHMHAKVAVIDSRWCLFGSYNLDFVSLLFNLELVIEVVGDTTPPALVAQLQDDLAHSPEIDLATWRKRPVHQRALSGLAYRFRRWL
jgi:cardiolipin synthase